MTTDQYRSLLAKLKLSQAAFAEAFGIGKRTSQGYANGLPIPIPTAVLLYFIDAGTVDFDEVKRLVIELIKEAAKARKKREAKKKARALEKS